jgi:hypothetical protein
MTTHEIPLSAFLGRKVRDADGRYVGRLVEMEARIELGVTGNDYVVHTYHISHFGFFDWMAGSILVQQLVERLGSAAGYRCIHLPAEQLQLSTSEMRVRHRPD